MVSATASHRTPPQSGLRRVVSASMAGTIVEWYEFFLYATAATLVFGTLMFPPSDDPYAGIIAAFVTYAVGFIARPLGGIVFGHFGDKYGRKKLLQVAIILVGVATFLKPSYRIAVTPRTGALAVRVQPVAVVPEPLQETRPARH